MDGDGGGESFSGGVEVIGGDFEGFGGDKEEGEVVFAVDFDIGFVAGLEFVYGALVF